jgi:hypothetical protein
MLVFAYRTVSSQLYPQPPVRVLPTNDWPPFVAQYREEGQLSFIWDMEPGSQTYELDYTDVNHWKRTIFSSTVQGAVKNSVVLAGGILTTMSLSPKEIYTETVDLNLAPNEWLSYGYLSNLQKKSTVFLRNGPKPGEVTAVETFDRPCFPFLSKAGVKECGKSRQNSIVTREFTYRAEDYILTRLISKVDGVVVEDVTLEKLTFK